MHAFNTDSNTLLGSRGTGTWKAACACTPRSAAASCRPHFAAPSATRSRPTSTSGRPFRGWLDLTREHSSRPEFAILSSGVVVSWPLTIRCSLASLHRYYDPKEDMAAYGGQSAGGAKKYAPNAPDGVNLVHSWNKMIDSGQSADEYVNGLHRYM